MKDFHKPPHRFKKTTKQVPKKNTSHSQTSHTNGVVKKILTSSYWVLFFLGVDLIIIGFTLYIQDKMSDAQTIESAAKPIYDASYPYVDTDKNLEISAWAYAIYDKSSRIIVDEKNSQLRFAPASTAKIMSALVALEYYSLDTILTAFNLENSEGSTMKLVEGERITVRNLLYGMMLPSGNDAAYVLSHNYPGGNFGFVSRMNQKASEMKLENTFFVDPAGYDDSNFSTAGDLVRLGAYALENPVFAEIVKTKSQDAYDVTGQIYHPLSNLNRMLDHKEVIGIKTGFTNEAGEVLVTGIDHNNSVYVVVVLKSHNRFEDTEKVIEKIIKRIDRVSY